MVILFWYFGPKIKDEFKELYLEKFPHDGLNQKWWFELKFLTAIFQATSNILSIFWILIKLS